VSDRQWRIAGKKLPSMAVSVTQSRIATLTALAERLRQLATPVIGRVHNGAVWLDVRAIDDADALCVSLDGL
jgi:L-seryl-tRNA(Ser) seleniumtransferase